jgi:hypothetical protein
MKLYLHSILAIALAVGLTGVAPRARTAEVGQTVEVGHTGFDVKRPVMAAACPNGCPWGELGDFVQGAMKPMGYDVILCRNCNRAEGPRIVGDHARPPQLTALDLYIGVTTRVDAPVDFGVTESGILASAYEGTGPYAAHGPYKNLRLIAKIEDPTYLLVAVKKDSGITDLAQIKERKLAVKILSVGAAAGDVLAYYGLTREAVTALGGSMGAAMGASASTPFDVVISDLGSPAGNPESAFWTTLSQKYDLRFLELPEPLLEKLAKLPGEERVSVKWGLLRGVDRIIPTVARSGEAVFARDDTPNAAAYALAKAIDRRRGDLKWYIRPYSYDSRTVSENLGVPLHPGAARYYREMGYIK